MLASAALIKLSSHHSEFSLCSFHATLVSFSLPSRSRAMLQRFVGPPLSKSCCGNVHLFYTPNLREDDVNLFCSSLSSRSRAFAPRSAMLAEAPFDHPILRAAAPRFAAALKRKLPPAPSARGLLAVLAGRPPRPMPLLRSAASGTPVCTHLCQGGPSSQPVCKQTASACLPYLA